MPVLIVDPSTPSDPKSGIINKNELEEVTDNFQNHVALTTISPTFTAIKTQSCFFKRSEVLQLLGIDPNQFPSEPNEGIRIYFGIHPNGQHSCEEDDYSNLLETVVFVTDVDGKDKNQINDSLLIPGYNTFSAGAVGDCCGSIKPNGR
jgi:hypothetical protein